MLTLTAEELARAVYERRTERMARLGIVSDTWDEYSPILRGRVLVREAGLILDAVRDAAPDETPEQVAIRAWQALYKRRAAGMVGLDYHSAYELYADITDHLAVIWDLPATVNPIDGGCHA